MDYEFHGWAALVIDVLGVIGVALLIFATYRCALSLFTAPLERSHKPEKRPRLAGR